MSDQDENRPEDIEELLKRLLSGEAINPEELAQAAGLPIDPTALAQLMNQLGAAMTQLNPNEGVNWDLALSSAREIARSGTKPVPESVGKQLAASSLTAALWLDEVTDFPQGTLEPKLLSRELWVADSIGLFKDLSSPVAERMANALSENFRENLPEEMDGMMAQASGMMKSAGSVMFAMQLGQALGKLSEEVLSGGDIGLPIFETSRAAFVPQNLSTFIEELDQESDQAYLYLAVRELAHARLFKHSKWLREYIVNLISSYAREITIDNSKIAELSENFDPNDLASIQQALEKGALIAPRTDAQTRALEAIETSLALIEGWVDCVSKKATVRLPKADAIGEAVRRRRATGGPAEKTFLTLIGLELRPRKLREASKMWEAITEAVGHERRDSIWEHPDLMPTESDIKDPASLIAKLSGGESDLDAELRDLLS
ncbi:MAG: zinc-dependent metalloprotease [Actinomycetota bacterium]